MSASKTWKPKTQAERDWLRGVKDACELMNIYNATSTHPYQLGDCVLAKLNIIARPRRRHVDGVQARGLP